MDKAFVHATVLTVDADHRIIEDGGLLVRGERIEAVGPSETIARLARTEGLECESLRGCLVLPGLVNTHTHLFQSLLKGIGSDRTMEDWWSHTIGRFAVHMDCGDFYASAAAGLLEAARSGTTTCLEYAYAHPVAGTADAIVQAAQDTGVRLVLGRGFNVSNPFVPAPLRESLKTALADAERLRAEYGARVPVWLAPAVNWTMTRAELSTLCEEARDRAFPVTMHLLETRTDDALWQESYGVPLMEDLDRMGLFDGRFLAVHFVDVDESDIRRAADKGFFVSYNPLSNMYLASGVCPVRALREAGVGVSLGTDGAASNNTLDMLETIKTGALLQKVHARDPKALSARQALRMATIEGARALGLSDRIGSLEPGKDADFIVFDPDAHLSALPVHDPQATLVYSSNTANIRDVVVRGRAVIRHGRVRTTDEAVIAQDLKQRAKALTDKAGGNHD